METQEKSLREDLEDAIGTVEGTSDGEGEHEEQGAAAEAPEGEAGEAEEGVSGKRAPAKEGAKPGKQDASQPDGQTAKSAAPQAPVGWSDEVKAKWAELDPSVQAAIVNRERHVERVLQDSADARQSVDNFRQMISPYAPLMQAEGVTDPLVAVNGLLQTVATLALGSPQQKATRIAQLINHYGVDIGTLDSLLVGEVPNPQENQLQQMLNQRLAPFDQLLQRVQQAEQQSLMTTQQEAAGSVEEFASNPENKYFGQVRTVMADFLDMAAQQGVQMTLEQAYERACMSVPDVATQVLAERQNGVNRNRSSNIAGKRAAASSVSGDRSGVGGSSVITDDMSLRETIAAQLSGGGRI